MKMRNFSLNLKRGLSLVEVAVSASIMTVVTVGAFSAFISAAKLQREIFNHTTVDQEARQVENWLVSDMRGAITVENSYTYNGTTYTNTSNTLILRMASVDANGVPISMGSTPATTTSDFIVYYHDANQQMRRKIVRNALSWRDGRNTAHEDRLLSKSSSKGIVYQSSFAAAPGVLGPVVVHYEFRSSRKNTAGKKDYSVASAGSVYLRNRPVDPT